MKPLITSLSLLILLFSSAVTAATPDWQNHPGDFARATKQLETSLQASFPGDIFDHFKVGRVSRPSRAAHDVAKQLLALHRMGKVTVHSDPVKRAYTYMFLTAFADETRQYELLDLYERIALRNSEDPTWRIIRVRSAKLLWLPEVPELYEQVANDMKGVPPSDAAKGLWDANREEFDIPPYTRELWQRQTTQFVYDGKGLDVPGVPPIEGSLFPHIDLAGSVGQDAQKWQEMLDASPATRAKDLDGMLAFAAKNTNLSWLNGRGFINSQSALSAHLLTKPADALVELRTLQEGGYQKAIAKADNAPKALKLFRRYPWAASAQRELLKSAGKSLFAGEAHAAFRCYQDVLQHADAKDLRETAQVGLWLSLSQCATPSALARAFEKVAADTTWPWYGKRKRTEVIKKQLLGEGVTELASPTLASLTPKIVKLPPMPVTVINIDMQRDGNQLLVSCPRALAMYPADNPVRPMWVMNRRPHRSGERYVTRRSGMPRFAGEKLITSWGGDSVADYDMLALNRRDKSVIASSYANTPRSRFLNRIIGDPVIADNKVYTLLLNQSHALMSRMHQSSFWGDIALGCFEIDGMKLLWTQRYEAANSTGLPDARKMVSSRPVISEGAVYIISNSGHVIRADSRDGKMDWIHFFRPSFDGSGHYNQPSSWCIGSAPLVTEDKVVCMSKLSGRIFALDKETGRRIWAVPRLRGYELLGRHEDLVLVTAANALYGIDLNTGKLRWARQIVSHNKWEPKWATGFQLPRAQLVGGSIYCGTKNNLYRFDANNGIRLETRSWTMENEVPMTFHIAGKNLYVLSDLASRDPVREKQLVDDHTVIRPANVHQNNQLTEIKSTAGNSLFYRDGMLFSIKGKTLTWARFVPRRYAWFRHGGKNLGQNGNEVSFDWSGTHEVHDLNTGKLLKMNSIKIEAK